MKRIIAAAEADLRSAYPAPLAQTSAEVSFRAGKVIESADVLNDPAAPASSRAIAQKTGRSFAFLCAPLLWEGKGIGTLSMQRLELGPFRPQEHALLKTFADQAVIAIQNARLFNETKEALERQTATAEILKAISDSPTDVQPVFDAIVRSGIRLFKDAAVGVGQPEGGEFHLKAIAEHDPAQAARWAAAFPFKIDRSYMHATALLDGVMVEMDDALAPTETRFAAGLRNFAKTGYRAMTVVPMLRGGVAIGTISVVRVAPGPLSERQKSLLQTFADQAVIAIENVRLVQRDEGGAGAPDRDERCAGSHQWIDGRCLARLRKNPRSMRASVRRDRLGDLSCRWDGSIGCGRLSRRLRAVGSPALPATHFGNHE